MKGQKNLSQRARVRELIKSMLPAEVASELGISRQRVYQILVDEDIDYLTLNRQIRLKRRDVGRILQSDHLDKHARGSISELQVAADLLELGWRVYVPLIRNHGYDIIATKYATLITIEVRSARRRRGGSVVTNRAKAIYPAHHFAFVFPDEPILYDPPLPIVEETAKRAQERGSTGRVRTYTEEQIRSAKALHENGVSWGAAAASIGISITRLQVRIRALCPTN